MIPAFQIVASSARFSNADRSAGSTGDIQLTSQTRRVGESFPGGDAAVVFSHIRLCKIRRIAVFVD
jgi:hypothetical protein